eukprot:2345383-Pyramimonas_sp.AAC.1
MAGGQRNLHDGVATCTLHSFLHRWWSCSKLLHEGCPAILVKTPCSVLTGRQRTVKILLQCALRI